MIQDASDTKFAGLITDGSVSAGISQFFTSTGPPPVHANESSNSARRKASMAASPPPTPSNPASPMHPTNPPPAADLSPLRDTSMKSETSYDTVPANNPRPTSSAYPASYSLEKESSSSSSSNPVGPTILTTTVVKGEFGIGLDLTKSKDGFAQVVKLKDLGGVVNPASICNPPIMPGDCILSVNGEKCITFADAVKLIRGAPSAVTLTIQRNT